MAKRTVNVDMSGVETFQRVPEGTHTMRITKAEYTQSQGGNDVIRCRFEVIKGQFKSTSLIESFSLSENALWKLKSLLLAVGMSANGRIKLDLDRLEGKAVDVLVVHEEYNGVWRAKVSELYKAGAGDKDDYDPDEEDDEDDEDEEPPKKSTKKAASKKPAKKTEPEDDDDDDDEEDDEDDDDDEEDEPAPPKKSAKSTSKKAPAKKASKKSDDDDEDDDDDDGWDED